MKQVHTIASRRSILASVALGMMAQPIASAQAQAQGPMIRLAEPNVPSGDDGAILIPRNVPVRLSFEAAPGASVNPDTLEIWGNRFLVRADKTQDVRQTPGVTINAQGISIPSLGSIEAPVDSFTLTVRISDSRGRQATWVRAVRKVDGGFLLAPR